MPPLGDAYGSGKGPGRRLWHERLSLYRRELGIDHEPPPARLDIAPFGDAMCTVVEDAKPEVVSFHFGLPSLALLARVKAAGCRVMSSATTVEEALRLEPDWPEVREFLAETRKKRGNGKSN